MPSPSLGLPTKQAFQFPHLKNRDKDCLVSPTYFSRCEETTVCSENTLGNLGKGAQAQMIRAREGQANQPYGYHRLSRGRYNSFSGVTKPIGLSTQNLAMGCACIHALHRKCACSPPLDSDPQITSLAFNQGEELQAERPASAPHTHEGLRLHARLSSRDLATKVVGLGYQPGTDRSDLQVHRSPSQCRGSEPAVKLSPLYYINHALAQREAGLSMSYTFPRAIWCCPSQEHRRTQSQAAVRAERHTCPLVLGTASK